MPCLPVVDFCCCGFSLRVGVAFITWIFLLVDSCVLVMHLVEASAPPDLPPPPPPTALDLFYVLHSLPSPLDALDALGVLSAGAAPAPARPRRRPAPAPVPNRTHVPDNVRRRRRRRQDEQFDQDFTEYTSAITIGPTEAPLPLGVRVVRAPLAMAFVASDFMLLLASWAGSRVLLATWLVATTARAGLEVAAAVATVARWVGARGAPPGLALRLTLRCIIAGRASRLPAEGDGRPDPEFHSCTHVDSCKVEAVSRSGLRSTLHFDWPREPSASNLSANSGRADGWR